MFIHFRDGYKRKVMSLRCKATDSPCPVGVPDAEANIIVNLDNKE